MGKPISTKYLDVTTTSGAKMRCRLCGTEVYAAPIQPGLDTDQMEALLEHFLFQHTVTREEIEKDLRNAFEEGMRQQECTE